MTQEEKYRIKERYIKEYGSIEKAIKAISEELEKLEVDWNKFSSEWVGHETTCSRLKINEQLENGKAED